MQNIKILATKKFDKEIRNYLDTDELSELNNYLGNNPDSGVVIKNTGGIRKLRWKLKKSNKGKRGGLRIIYFIYENLIIILLTVYLKTEKEDLTQSERDKIQNLIRAMIEELDNEKKNK